MPERRENYPANYSASSPRPTLREMAFFACIIGCSNYRREMEDDTMSEISEDSYPTKQETPTIRPILPKNISDATSQRAGETDKTPSTEEKIKEAIPVTRTPEGQNSVNSTQDGHRGIDDDGDITNNVISGDIEKTKIKEPKAGCKS